MTNVVVVGRVFDRLTVVEYDESRRGRGRHWLCKCACGTVTTVRETRLLNGETTSCRCKRTTHGMHGTRTYAIWRGVMSRCLNSKTANFRRYGALGITIAPEWQTFEGFFAAMGECPEGLTIERKDGRLGYVPGNCEWASTKTQARNRSNNVRVSLNGEEMVLMDWCERLDRRFKIVSNRIRTGWTHERALTTPTNGGFTKWQK